MGGKIVMTTNIESITELRLNEIENILDSKIEEKITKRLKGLLGA